MKISIITATYNSSITILDCINSVNNQSYKDIEHIIIDGLSTDNTINLIKSVSSRVKVVVSEKDNGIYDAMNKGISLATGEIIAILNSDDVYASSCVIEEVVSFFKANSNLGILYGDLQYVKKDNIQKVVRVWNSLPYFNNFFENGNVPPHPSTFLLKKIYDEFGAFNLKYRLAADYEFMLRVFKKSKLKILYVPSLIVKMRLGGATNKNIKNIYLGNFEILNAWRDNNLKIPILLMFKRLYKRIIQFA
jgi:glycosyltransferase involved in cell wall biosynthesis